MALGPSLDFNILATLMHRDRYMALSGSVPTELLDDSTAAMIRWLAVYFDAHPDHLIVEPSALLTLMRLRGKLSEDQAHIMGAICQRLAQPIDPSVMENTVQTLEELRLSGEAAALVTRYQAGEEIDIVQELSILAHRTQERVKRSSGAKWADGDPLAYLERDAEDSGLQWEFLPILHGTMKGLNEGDNIALAAPTNAGKTSFLCRAAVEFAHQVHRDGLYDGRPMLYLVNEGTEERITNRIFQTAVSKPFPEVLQMARAGTLVPAFCEYVGRRDAIRVANIHGMNIGQVSRIIDAHSPWMVVTDMTGRIRANGNTGGANDIGQLEDVWNSQRELAAIMKYIHFGTIQVSAEGFDQLYPPISALQNSKTGVQTTLDMLLMLGYVRNQEALKNVRGLSTPKSKFARAGYDDEQKFEVVFDKHRNIWDSGAVAAPGKD